jgi:hypothetical protein
MGTWCTEGVKRYWSRLATLGRDKKRLEEGNEQLRAEIERLQRYPAALKQIREEEKPGHIIPPRWHIVRDILDRIEQIANGK